MGSRKTLRTRSIIAAIVGACFACLPRGTSAAEWLTPSDGAWTDGSKWSTAPNYPGDSVLGAIPATIDAGAVPFTVSLASPIRIDDLMLKASNLTLDLRNGGAIDVGRKGNPHLPPCYIFPCGESPQPPNGITYFVGTPADLIVGQSGAGSSVEQLGGNLKVSDRIHIGATAGETGEYTIAGGNLEITRFWAYSPCCFIPGPGAWGEVGGDFRVGDGGSGKLNIIGGGSVKVPTYVPTSLGGQLESHGSVRVSGPGSKWTVARSIGASSSLKTIVGGQGVGSLVVEDGGVASLFSMVIGKDATGSGAVTVQGAGSQLILDETITINSGKVHATDNAKLLPNFGIAVSPRAGTSAELLVEGGDTEFDGWLKVEGNGAASAVIRDGALATTYWAFVGGNSGKLTVDGPGTEWRILADNYVPHTNSYLYVMATGAVEITGGARVTSQMSKIGMGDGDNGVVSLDGPTTRWENLTSIYIGGGAPENAPNINYGHGTLSLSNDATVSVGGVLKVWPLGRIEGSGTINGNVDNDGVIDVGQSAGRLEIDGDLNHAGKLEMEIGGASVGQFDRLEASGDVTLAGLLELALLDDYFPRASESFSILAANSLSGEFSNVAPGSRLNTADGVGSFAVQYGPGSSFSANEVVLTNFLPSGLPGDYNDDGLVSASDYSIWRNSLGDTGPRLAADGDNNHVVDEYDYQIWKNNFGARSDSEEALGRSVVPEPTSAMLLAIASIGVTMYRRRSRYRISSCNDLARRPPSPAVRQSAGANAAGRLRQGSAPGRPC